MYSGASTDTGAKHGSGFERQEGQLLRLQNSVLTFSSPSLVKRVYHAPREAPNSNRKDCNSDLAAVPEWDRKPPLKLRKTTIFLQTNYRNDTKCCNDVCSLDNDSNFSHSNK